MIFKKKKTKRMIFAVLLYSAWLNIQCMLQIFISTKNILLLRFTSSNSPAFSKQLHT